MPSVWISRREGATGSRHRVLYRIGGHEETPKYGGSFKRVQDAHARRRWIEGELAAMRMPDLRLLVETPKSPTLVEAAETWRSSRVDVAEQTANMHRSSVARIFKVAPHLRSRRIDELDVDDVTALIAALVETGYRRESVKKSRDALAMLLDFHDAKPNPARDTRVKLPREEREEPDPPPADHVETVYRLLPSVHTISYLFLDWSGARVAAIDQTAGRRLRRAARPRAPPRRDDEDAEGAVDRPSPGARGRNRGEHRPTRRPRPGYTPVRVQRVRRPPHVNREGVQGGGHPDVQPARSPSPPRVAAPLAGLVVGADRRATSGSGTSRSPRTPTRTSSPTRPGGDYAELIASRPPRAAGGIPM